MKNKKVIFERKILIDAPSKKDFFQGKGHEKTALALAQAITEFEHEDRAIGLDGAWGSGKSSVVEMAIDILKSESASGSTNFSFFTFDIWKSQGTTFRRTFLEHFVSWAKQKFPKKKLPLEKIEKRIKGKTKHLTTDSNPMLDWYGVGVLVILPFLPIFYFWAKKVFDDPNTENFLNSSPMWCLYLFLAATVVRASVKYNSDDSESPSFLSSLSRTLLITAKQYENQEITQHIREVDPNDFEFQETLSDILSVLQGPKHKIVLVLDNIDRIPEDEIEDYWSAVRSIFSKSQPFEKPKNNTEITAIVPYHRDHILPPDTDERNNKKDGQVGALAKRELFSKTFDEVLYVAPPVMSNTREFFETKISEAIPNYTDKDEIFRTYLIFSSNLSAENGHFTPRQIIAFINELTGLFAMHRGLYALTTVAVYICFREQLERDPFELARPKFLDAKLRRLAPDADLEQNLAAILYNVDSQLALELLLDPRIAAAATNADDAPLIELSKSRGFELRVDEVIQDSHQEWVSSGQLGQVIRNFASLGVRNSGDATNQIVASLRRALTTVPSIALIQKEYEPYFGLLDMTDEPDVSSVLNEIVSKTFNGISSKTQSSFSDAESWLNFLEAIRLHLGEDSAQEKVEAAISSIALPSSADFLLGCAYFSSEKKIPLTSYLKVELPTEPTEEGEDPLLEFAQKNYHLSFPAFSELISAKAVSASHWLSVGQGLIESMQADENQDTEQFSESLKVLVLIMHNLPKTQRGELQIADLVGASEFYAGFDKAFSDSPEDEGVAHALYLAYHVYKGENMPALVGQANGTASKSSLQGFKWFKEQYDGELVLSGEQLNLIAQHAFDDKQVTRWVGTGSALEGHALVDGVVKAAFERETIPFVSLSTFLTNFDYLQSTLSEAFPDTLRRFQVRFDKNAIEAIELSELPVGVLAETQDVPGERWKEVHEFIGTKLQEIDPKKWLEHFQTASHEADLLEEKSKTTGIEISHMAFRDAFQRFALGVLDGTTPPPNANIDFDAVFSAIPESFHADLYKQSREKIASASPDGLTAAATLFPNYLEGLVRNGDKVMAAEKENVVRHILSTALEANNSAVLNMFLRLGRPKVAGFIKASDDATKDRLKGSMDNFRKLSKDHSYTREISDLVNGKQKTKNLWNIWFAPSADISDDD